MMAEPKTMTNRELFEAYQNGKGARRYSCLEEMTKRIQRSIITPDVPQIFSQYKLNGAGCQRW